MLISLNVILADIQAIYTGADCYRAKALMLPASLLRNLPLTLAQRLDMKLGKQGRSAANKFR